MKNVTLKHVVDIISEDELEVIPASYFYFLTHFTGHKYRLIINGEEYSLTSYYQSIKTDSGVLEIYTDDWRFVTHSPETMAMFINSITMRL